ncbi:DHS-like NAD/FAD-binding domain-containing protein [Umbelopsis sp. PMI_123]|nr:DHS-like NAD/FAD-binding domain-containing protein [Umbelopsis sp. PMI_123]
MLKSTIIPNVRMPDFPMAQETREPDADSIVDLSEAVDRVAELIEGSRNKTIVLTGAGASTDSGIPDYRSPTGRYVKNHTRPIFFQEFLANADFRRRYWARGYLGWPQMLKAKPNSTHYSLQSLIEQGHIRNIITQNVDHLHHEAGTPEDRVVELHGSLYEVSCLSCHHITSRFEFQQRLDELNQDWKSYQQEIVASGGEPKTNPDGDVELPSTVSYDTFNIPPCDVCGERMMKPRVVFFGENIETHVKEKAAKFVEECESMLVIGSSLATFSAFRLVKKAKELGKPVGVLNMGPTRSDSLIDWKIELNSSTVLEEVLRQRFQHN